ncbi:MAG: DUF4082 domain-containing protein [Acidobacteria bacterium]|nr:DUF4082 domain-containing protein [Acidobacteriota bacterium]
MRAFICVVTILVCAPVAWGQAITGFVGGSEYDSYYGSVGGDVIGWRFTVNASLEISDLGVWNADQTGGIESTHQVGIWDGSQTLVASVTVDGTGTVVGDWIYAAITPVTLMPGQTYTIGASYASGDDDWYISSASSMSTHADMTWTGSVYPEAIDMGFVYPSSDSASYGRFGPNFMFETVVIPVGLETFTVE